MDFAFPDHSCVCVCVCVSGGRERERQERETFCLQPISIGPCIAKTCPMNYYL